MKNLINYFIPLQYLDDKELHQKSKFIVWFVYITVAISSFFSVYTYSIRPDDYLTLVLGFAIPIIFFLALAYFKRTGSFITTTHIICGLFTLAMSAMPDSSGGIFSPDMPTLYILPIFALVMGNQRVAMFYSVLMMSIFVAYYVLALNDFNFYMQQMVKLPSEYFLFNITLNACVIIFLVFRNENLRQKLLGEVKETNKIIVEKNREITDSITYARRIQSAILPQQQRLQDLFPQSFFLYKPKDIVSGDFFWMAEKDGFSFLVVADCTGHGVPGAFMSMIGVNQLNSIVNEKGITEPSKILEELNTGIVSALQQHQTETNDGMDMALLKIHFPSKRVEYAGANRPLYRISGNVLSEIKASKFPIGGFNSGSSKKFESHSISMQPGDMIYLSTDGYADQFGGEKHKKITTKKFKMLLESISSSPVKDQEKQLSDFMSSWMGKNEQIDDILVAGLRF